MNQSDQQLQLLVAAHVLEIAATIRQEDFDREGIRGIADRGERDRQAMDWNARNPISAYIPTALETLQGVERQIAVLTQNQS
jgi:hypothetical protein